MNDHLGKVMSDSLPNDTSNVLLSNMVSYLLGPDFSLPKRTGYLSRGQDGIIKLRKENFSGKRGADRSLKARLASTIGSDFAKSSLVDFTEQQNHSTREVTSSLPGTAKRNKLSSFNRETTSDELKNIPLRGDEANHVSINPDKAAPAPSSEDKDISVDDDKENHYTVGKDGHISEAVLNRFKGKPPGSGAVSSAGNMSNASKPNRLFSGKPKANRLKPVSEENDSGVEKQRNTRLASKTPGMKKLDFNIGKPPAVASSKASNRDIAASLFPSNDKNCIPGPDHCPEENTEAIPEVRTTDERGEVERAKFGDGDNNENEGRNTSERHQNDVPQKKSHALEPLFPPGLFDVGTSPLPKSKKSISFAPEVSDIGMESINKKRQGSELPESAASVKRQRPAERKEKSELRERIENMRLRFSTRTVDSPQTTSKVDTNSSNHSPHPSSKEVEMKEACDPQLNCVASQDEQGRKSSGIASDTGDRDEEFVDANDFEKSMKSEYPSSTFTDRSPSGHSSSIQTPTVALESKFDAASPDYTSTKQSRSHLDVDAVMTDAVPKNGTESPPEPSSSAGAGMLSNIYTSVKSLLPNSSTMFGFPAESQSQTDSKDDTRMSVAERQRLDIERREAELQARREAAQAARQLQQREKQKKVEENRRLQAEEKFKREQEQKRKEAIRLARLREDLEQRKKKKAEEDRKRELRRQRVKEHQEKVAAAEEAKRLELESRYQADRFVGLKAKPKPKAGPSAGAKPSGSKGAQAAGPSSGVSGTPAVERKKSVEVTSYEMSAERVRGADDDDDDSDSERMAKRKGKKIPTWAQKENVLKAIEKQTGDPDKHFSRVQSVNLEEVFASTQQNKKRYRARNSSGQWTKDRLTAKEEMEYKKKAGFI